MLTWEQRYDVIVVHAWETWTGNGLGMDEFMREQTTKTVQDAATNVYCDDMDDMAWLKATINRLDRMAGA